MFLLVVGDRMSSEFQRMADKYADKAERYRRELDDRAEHYLRLSLRTSRTSGKNDD